MNITVTAEWEGHLYRYESHVTINRKHGYYRGVFTKDGVKGDVRLFKKLEAQLAAPGS